MGTLRFAHQSTFPIEIRSRRIEMDYRRARIPGGTYFFTLVTAQRRPLLLNNIGRLREAFRVVKQRYPFRIEAIVILPDHLHAIWRLPAGDSDYSLRWSLIKRFFQAGFRPACERHPSDQSVKRESGSGATGSTAFVMKTICAATWITFTTTP